MEDEIKVAVSVDNNYANGEIFCSVIAMTAKKNNGNRVYIVESENVSVFWGQGNEFAATSMALETVVILMTITLIPYLLQP